jgi:N-glycosylase/DNA lyase
VPAPDFDLALTLGCGQVFHWVKAGEGFRGVIGDKAVYVEKQGGELLVTRGCEDIARRYFALDHPLDEIYATFPDDPDMAAALEFCRGLRIIRQPLWECVATFITSSMKQVAHIAQISHTLRQRFGRQAEGEDAEGESLFAYPSPPDLARLEEADLRACALGYRAVNLLGSARMIASGEVDLDAISALDDREARAMLCRLPGVGVKVANCALLFAYERFKAFPIDVWIERVLREFYFKGKRRVTVRRLEEFSSRYFGEYGGYAQQYLFHYARKTWKEREASTAPAERRSPKPKVRKTAAKR